MGYGGTPAPPPSLPLSFPLPIGCYAHSSLSHDGIRGNARAPAQFDLQCTRLPCTRIVSLVERRMATGPSPPASRPACRLLQVLTPPPLHLGLDVDCRLQLLSLQLRWQRRPSRMPRLTVGKRIIPDRLCPSDSCSIEGSDVNSVPGPAPSAPPYAEVIPNLRLPSLNGFPFR